MDTQELKVVDMQVLDEKYREAATRLDEIDALQPRMKEAFSVLADVDHLKDKLETANGGLGVAVLDVLAQVQALGPKVDAAATAVIIQSTDLLIRQEQLRETKMERDALVAEARVEGLIEGKNEGERQANALVMYPLDIVHADERAVAETKHNLDLAIGESSRLREQRRLLEMQLDIFKLLN